jgi:hypothetical protein
MHVNCVCKHSHFEPLHIEEIKVRLPTYGEIVDIVCAYDIYGQRTYRVRLNLNIYNNVTIFSQFLVGTKQYYE